MLVLRRRPGSSVQIGEEVKLTVVKIEGNAAVLSFDAPPHVRIDRTEVKERRDAQDQDQAL